MCASVLNKTREVLKFIASRKVVASSEITSHKALLEMFSGKASARRRLIDTTALLGKQGFVSIGVLDGERVYKINAKGLRKLQSYQTMQDGVDRTRWLGRWYLVTYDVPESAKSARNQLILTLKRQGFVNYTKGVWLLPYNPSKLIAGLRKDLGLAAKSLRLIVATHIDDEPKYKKQFGLD